MGDKILAGDLNPPPNPLEAFERNCFRTPRWTLHEWLRLSTPALRGLLRPWATPALQLDTRTPNYPGRRSAGIRGGGVWGAAATPTTWVHRACRPAAISKFYLGAQSSDFLNSGRLPASQSQGRSERERPSGAKGQRAAATNHPLARRSEEPPPLPGAPSSPRASSGGTRAHRRGWR